MLCCVSISKQAKTKKKKREAKQQQKLSEDKRREYINATTYRIWVARENVSF